MCPDVLLVQRLDEQRDDIKTVSTVRARFEQRRAIGMHHPVGVFNLCSLSARTRSLALIEQAACRENLDVLDGRSYAVSFHIRPGLRPANPLMDERIMPHV